MKHPKTFRLPPELIERLERYARAQRRSLTAVVEAALDKHLALAEQGSNGARRDDAAPVAAPEPIDLAQWISDRTGTPRAVVGRYVRAGRVTIDGAEHRELEVSPEELGQVKLDGEVIRG